jgi:hypothetical protein
MFRKNFKKYLKNKRKGNIKRKLYKKKVATRAHVFKRYANEMIISNDSAGIPVVNQTNSNWKLANTNASAYLPNAVNFGVGGYFTINEVTEASDFTNLFDRYKIVGVKLKFLYQQNTSAVNGTSSFPVIAYAFDGDDSTPPTGINDVQRKGYCHEKVLNANKTFSLYIKPRVSKMMYSQTLSGLGGYSSEKPCWLDCQASEVPHYGIKFWIKDWVNVAGTFQNLTVQPVYYLAMKDSQ